MIAVIKFAGVTSNAGLATGISSGVATAPWKDKGEYAVMEHHGGCIVLRGDGKHNVLAEPALTVVCTDVACHDANLDRCKCFL